MLKNLNFYISSFIPQKIYWYLAGFIHPWQSVLEDTNSASEVYNRGDDFVKILNKFNLISKKSKVLDIGCGVGRVEYSLHKYVDYLVGVDISYSMVRLAKKNISYPNTRFYENNGKDLRLFKDNSFDLIFSVIVFQHLPTTVLENYLKESYRVLTDNGGLIFQISLDEKDKKTPPPLNHPWALRYYSSKELMNLLLQNNFKDVKFFNADGEILKKQDSQALVLAFK